MPHPWYALNRCLFIGANGSTNGNAEWLQDCKSHFCHFIGDFSALLYVYDTDRSKQTLAKPCVGCVSLNIGMSLPDTKFTKYFI